jgi:hypothetical protein
MSSSKVRFSWRRAGLLLGSMVLASGATLLAVHAGAAGIPAANALTYTGYIETPDGKPVTTPVNLTVHVWNMATAGAKVCEIAVENVTPVAGRFQVALPDSCATAAKASPDLWLELVVDGSSLGRTKLGVVPYALEAGHATNADNATKADSATSADKASAAAGALATELADKITQGGQATLSCPADMSRIEASCIDNKQSAAVSLQSALDACDQAGKEVCNIDQLYACDSLEAASTCKTDTDTAATILWSGTLSGTNAFWTYTGNNSVTSESTSSVHPYYCCSPAGVVLK